MSCGGGEGGGGGGGGGGGRHKHHRASRSLGPLVGCLDYFGVIARGIYGPSALMASAKIFVFQFKYR